MKRRTLYTIKKDGFHVEEFCHVGQWGTHIDPPAHFHDGLKTVDQIDPRDMLMPLVVLDVHEKVAKNPDYVLSLDDVHKNLEYLKAGHQEFARKVIAAVAISSIIVIIISRLIIVYACKLDFYSEAFK